MSSRVRFIAKWKLASVCTTVLLLLIIQSVVRQDLNIHRETLIRGLFDLFHSQLVLLALLAKGSRYCAVGIKNTTLIIHRFCISSPLCLPQDPASSTASEADSDTREGEPVTINYKPSPLQMKIGE